MWPFKKKKKITVIEEKPLVGGMAVNLLPGAMNYRAAATDRIEDVERARKAWNDDQERRRREDTTNEIATAVGIIAEVASFAVDTGVTDVAAGTTPTETWGGAGGDFGGGGATSDY